MASNEKLIAEVLFRQYAPRTDNAIDLEAIARGEDIEIRDLPNGRVDSASGKYSIEGGMPIIYVNRFRPRTHQRFTLAHELGHHFLRHGPRPRDTKEQLQKRDPVEFAANRFAAELLMPAAAVKKAVLAAIPTGRMAQQFEVSEVAMSYRLQNLGYI